jgi:DNA polymerase III epsilon subunit family exonuclease
MNHTKFVALDIETTGLDIRDHEVIQIGCVLFSYNEKKGIYVVDDEIEINIKPSHIETANKTSLKINKYNDTDWVDAVSLKKGLQKLMRKVKDRVMVAHNASFDYHFLDLACKTQDVPNTLHYHILDTLSMAYATLHHTDAKQLSLRYLCDYFKIENKKAHTALSDARATYELFVKLTLK